MKRLISLFIPLLAAAFLSGCVFSSAPPDNSGFDDIRSISDIGGIYRNLGEGGEGAPRRHLSEVIWPEAPGIDHDAISTIEIRSPGPGTITVKALGERDAPKKEDVFVEGRDFTLRAGRIRLERRLEVAGVRGGEPLVGLHSSNYEIGLDRSGHGKLKRVDTAAGLGFLVIPIAIRSSEEVRFVRIAE